LKEMGALESLFAQDSPLAEKSCALMCAHRRLAGFLAVALSVDLPVAISRRTVLHTWPAYRGALSIFFATWTAAFEKLDRANVPIDLIAGKHDRSQVEGLAHALAAKYSCVTATRVKDAAHILPITHGEFCADQVLNITSSGGTSP
ncbi:MAG: hypothetical protein M3Y27_10035, partial [Acidobacteriota bacterium]|nr:hypothetical protein [Acidobacteriota bacterium]